MEIKKWSLLLFGYSIILIGAGLGSCTDPADGNKPGSDQINHLPFDSLFIATQGEKQGLIDRTGNPVIPFIYDEVYATKVYPSTGVRYMYVKNNNKSGLIDSTGQAIIPVEYDQLRTLTLLDSDTLYAAKKGEKTGIITLHGKVIVPFEIDVIYNEWISGKTYCKLGDKYVMLDENGQLGSEKYNTEEDAKKMLYAALPDTSIFDYHNNRARVYIHSKDQGGYIDVKGRWAIPVQWKYTEDFSEGLAAVSPDGKEWFYIDTSGKVVIPGPYKKAASFADGVACVNGDSLISNKGELIWAGQYHVMEYFSEYKFFHVSLVDYNSDGQGYVNTGGEIIVNPRYYDEAGLPSEGMIPVCKYADMQDGTSNIHKREWGFVDIKGKSVIPLIYSDINNFSQGLVTVRKDGKWGYIDKTGKTIIPFQFDHAESFDRGLARVYEKGKMAYIDMAGKIIWQEK